MNEDELKKGCGKETIAYSHMDCNDNDVYFRCGQFNLDKGIIEYCEICQARLEGFQKGKLEERERILKLIDKEIEFWKAKPNEVVNIVFGLECLKEQLQKEIGGMK